MTNENRDFKVEKGWDVPIIEVRGGKATKVGTIHTKRLVFDGSVLDTAEITEKLEKLEPGSHEIARLLQENGMDVVVSSHGIEARPKGKA